MISHIESKIFPAIKVTSTILIISAIAWEIGNIYITLINLKIPNSFNFIFWIERFALSAHLLEAIIAAFYAPTKGKSSLQYGIYTFLVGTVGLWELFDSDIKTLVKKGPKKPQPQRPREPHRPHVSTARLLAQKQRSKKASILEQPPSDAVETPVKQTLQS